jgi:uncharacterized protein
MNTSPLQNPKLYELLRAHGVVEAAVFGSFAKNTHVRPDSDLDLLVTYKEGTTLFDTMSLQTELEEVLGRPVDLISKRSLSKRLEVRIKDHLKPLSLV